ncbi:PREDICTED: alpha-1,6-mannosylglycoprotein 6-beta-N-acetylglucosaminyltransferase B isoform X3 [Gavialis gangeticus]|uniref:alpha-1,6-mannosylglycoprotein 6-beta-N-acetylglucosaminyltransferase B isoform X1 n=1 Tax=Gavialis gangeticus TaxID=94835 RepID=UPI00092F784E|nr:PREDICTED: alpha-1,6-mannosylglycoprotein 6-beta-N-acetylglucosaminyltransferase B isoform X1 [Gavialis gangeticus]XP_019358439.1 PREDICTED: alpha-1,6-mannosylglycoprotein 6-beta-N-acetylglucosaminyltransferase B isoform X3 [Gavialis gangeticus]
MITVNSDGKIMVRRCLVTLRPFRIFVLGIGFFTLCFLMTSLGGQFSAKRLGDSPFTIRTEVMGALESRGVLRKMSDMLEMMVKRMDVLARLENSTDFRKGEEAHYPVDRFQPAVGLMERIQAIAQNVSDIAIKVDQILRNSLMNGKVVEGRRDQCEAPRDPKYPDCSGKVEWMRARWTSDPCYAFFGVDGTECSFLIYLSEVEWFCPPLPWRNQTAAMPSPKPLPKAQAAFRSDLSYLLELIGSGKESLIFMKKRIRHLAMQWILATRRLEQKLKGRRRDQKQILVHIGFLTEESGDVFSPRVLKGGPLGEMVQWADILAALFILGHSLKVTVSLKELQSNLGVPPGRGNCPLTIPLPFDLIYTDYHGLQQMKQHMGLSFKKYRCRVRVIDTFGTEPAYNHEEYATLHGYRTNWGYWNLNPKQFMTMFPHTPDNSFMGFVSEELNETEKQFIKSNKVSNMAVVYGKEASIWKLQGKEKFLAILNKYMEIHGTVYYETQRPPEVPAFVKNHGLLPQHEFQQLLRKAKLFIGFGFPYEGPAPLEAIANGCVFLQSRFNPPHSSLNHEFFRGKPTSREVSSQHPYVEDFIGKPHVWTVDYNNSEEFEAAIKAIMRTKVDPYLPYEYTCEGMLERIHAYIQHQDFCAGAAASLSAKPGSHAMQSSLSPFTLLPNASHLMWAHNASSSPQAWPPVHSMQVWVSEVRRACTETCQEHGLVCEPTFFKFLNKKDVFLQLSIACDSTEYEMNHLYPAVAETVRECYLQKEPLLYSCAGYSIKYRRLCPCRDYQKGQVALCRDCL